MPLDGTVNPDNREPGLQNAIILIIDDDLTMRIAISNTLKAAGCADVLHTGNGHDGLRMVGRQRVDLILCDWQMPAMSGLDFLAALRAMPEGAELPVLMLTVNNDPRDAWQARQHRVTGWLVKPVAPQNVAAQVALTLGRRAPRIRENVLDQLIAKFEAELPQVAAELAAQAAVLDPASPCFQAALDALYRRLHQVKGQAGTMGYALLGDLAGTVHDVLRGALADPPEALREELTRLCRVGLAGMKLVADRRLRGDGGAVGERMRRELGAFAAELEAKLGQARAPQGGQR